jgi:SAM-dependent methyltransferase
MMTTSGYVHGRSGKEETRLYDQANSLSELLHHDTRYPPGCRVLEAGCGVGAQTIILTKNNPGTRFTSVDISQESIGKARSLIASQRIGHVTFVCGDIYNLGFEELVFDHVFVCFVLEHLQDPLGALVRLKSHLKPGGSITVIEGDHGSTYFHPDSAEGMKTVQCLIDIQARLGGNSLIGRQVYPLLKDAGFRDVNVTPRMVYVDGNVPTWIEGFTKNTFIAMVAGVKEKALALGMMDEESWDRGIADMYKTANADGTFCYTFFKGVAVR